ncbi:MAG TPA: hypothetical protein VGG06_01415 [Thermoanaerobaculia bacterium]|jgi:nucleoside 2-deoxyribosyltransferase
MPAIYYTPSCFLAAPHTAQFDGIRRLTRDVLDSYGVELVPPDEGYAPDNGSGYAIDGLKRADMVIADVTGLNPNVLFELGIGFGLRKPLLIVSRSGQDLPSDISVLTVVFYKPEDTEKLEPFIRYWVKESMGQPVTTS